MKKLVIRLLALLGLAPARSVAAQAQMIADAKAGSLAWKTKASEAMARAKGLEAEANSLLQWKAMQWMMHNGIEWYETGEAFPHLGGGKAKGLSDFKKSFGGSLYPYYKGRLKISGLFGKLYRLNAAS